MEPLIIKGLAGFGGVGVFYAIAKVGLWLNDLRKASKEAKEAAAFDAAMQSQQIEHLQEQVKIGAILEDLNSFLKSHAPQPAQEPAEQT